MPIIKEYFEAYFSHWGIRLPPEAISQRQSGHLFEQGWHIGFVWGREGDEEYLEFLAQHRMTDDRRQRVYESGHVEDLEAPSGMTILPEGASQEEEKALVEASAREHRRISAELRQRGLLPPHGHNLPAHEINEHLRSGGDASCDRDSEWPPPASDCSA